MTMATTLLETLGAGALWTVANDIEPWELCKIIICSNALEI